MIDPQKWESQSHKLVVVREKEVFLDTFMNVYVQKIQI